MRILILGSGLMGPAAAYYAMIDPDVSRVTLCDLNQRQLNIAQAKLEGMQGGEKLDTVVLDVFDRKSSNHCMAIGEAPGSGTVCRKSASRRRCPDVPTD